MVPRTLGNEAGETEIGLIVGALFLGVLCFLVFSLDSCIFEHKEGKVEANLERERRQREAGMPIKRERSGSVRYVRPRDLP